MKKLAGTLLALITIYCIYFDMTVGTLPHVHTQKTAAETVIQSKVSIPYFKTKVKPGDTLISIVEHQLKKPLPIPINDLIRDFQFLNPKVKSDKIQLGKTYRFPDYTK